MTTTSPLLPSDREPLGTRAWRRFFRALVARSPQSGSAIFDNTDHVVVTLNPPLPDAAYNVLLEASSQDALWVTSKSKSDFVLRSAGPISATIGYTMVRR